MTLTLSIADLRAAGAHRLDDYVAANMEEA
jgi:hypothetical protein